MVYVLYYNFWLDFEATNMCFSKKSQWIYLVEGKNKLSVFRLCYGMICYVFPFKFNNLLLTILNLTNELNENQTNKQSIIVAR